MRIVAGAYVALGSTSTGRPPASTAENDFELAGDGDFLNLTRAKTSRHGARPTGISPNCFHCAHLDGLPHTWSIFDLDLR